jgi:hypothetical protein
VYGGGVWGVGVGVGVGCGVWVCVCVGGGGCLRQCDIDDRHVGGGDEVGRQSEDAHLTLSLRAALSLPDHLGRASRAPTAPPAPPLCAQTRSWPRLLPAL